MEKPKSIEQREVKGAQRYKLLLGMIAALSPLAGGEASAAVERDKEMPQEDLMAMIEKADELSPEQFLTLSKVITSRITGKEMSEDEVLEYMKKVKDDMERSAGSIEVASAE